MKIGVIATIFFVGVCVGLWGGWYFLCEKVNRSYQTKSHIDTVEVKGKPDTVRVMKYVSGKATLPRPADEKVLRIDTLIRDEKAEIRIFCEDVRTKPIEVSYVLGCEEIRVERVDTIQVTEIREQRSVTVPVRVDEERRWWDEFEWGLAVGVTMVVAGVLVGSN